MRLALALLLLVLSASLSFAEQVNIIGHVVSITDGDTLKIVTNEKKQFKVRLAEIDAPEKDQPYGKNSKQALSDLVFNKDVKVIQSAIDRYNRTVGYVFLNDVNINLELVKQGMVWVYTQYSHSKEFKEQEEIAKDNKIGLWKLQDDQKTAPWEWRKQKKLNKTKSRKE